MAQDPKSAATGPLAQAGAPQGPGSRHAKQGERMTGAQAVIASLEAEGVQLVFGYPGGQAIQIYDALYDSKSIHHILARHEQGAVHEADGYARATGKVGVALVTSGPGATNTVTGIATAYMDSVPLVVVCGQVPLGKVGTDSFQESDIVGITLPVVKHSYLVKAAKDIPRTFREAFHIAKTGRPGPVLIDIPSDIAAQSIVFKYSDSVNIPSYHPTYRGNARQIKAACKLIAKSRRPVIYVGGGAVSASASELVCRLSRICNIPVVNSLMGKGVVPCDEPLNVGMAGMHGSQYANRALDDSDLIIACGARFSDRMAGRYDSFAPEAKVIHIDIDPAEIGKVREVQVPIVGDLSQVLKALVDQIEASEERPDTADWLARIRDWKNAFPLTFDEGDDSSRIAPKRVMAQLSDALDPQASIVVTEVGQHQMWAAQIIRRDMPRSFISSGGLGTMGFGFPAAIGAAFGCPDKTVVCVAGDGSFQMNSQEMATAAVNGVPVKVIVMDNRSLGMVHQWQKMFFGGRYSETELADNPDFVLLARAYSWEAERVERSQDVSAALERMLASNGPYLLDVKISRDEDVFPMVAPGHALSDAVVSGQAAQSIPADAAVEEGD